MSYYCSIEGYSGLFWGKDLYVDKETGRVLKKSEVVRQAVDETGILGAPQQRPKNDELMDTLISTA